MQDNHNMKNQNQNNNGNLTYLYKFLSKFTLSFLRFLTVCLVDRSHVWLSDLIYVNVGSWPI